MPKHLHLIAVPEAKDDLNPAMGESHVTGTGEDNIPGKAQPPQGRFDKPWERFYLLD